MIFFNNTVYIISNFLFILMSFVETEYGVEILYSGGLEWEYLNTHTDSKRV